jgi:hypothetical protein
MNALLIVCPKGRDNFGDLDVVGVKLIKFFLG